MGRVDLVLQYGGECRHRVVLRMKLLKRWLPSSEHAAPDTREALAAAYAPIIQSFLLPCAVYYLYVSWGHWQDEVGAQRLVLTALSISTAIYCLAARHWLTAAHKVTFGAIEWIALAANLLIYANVALYMQISFVEEKLVYFILISIVFTTSGITFRSSLLSVGLAMATMLWFAADVSSELLAKYVSIGVAASVVAVGMSYLLRKAMKRQVRARLAADKLASEATHQANTDMLTLLPGRRAAFAEISRQIAHGEPWGMSCSNRWRPAAKARPTLNHTSAGSAVTSLRGCSLADLTKPRCKSCRQICP